MALCSHSRARILCLNDVGSFKTATGRRNKCERSGRPRHQRAPNASSSRTVAVGAAAGTQPSTSAEAPPSAEFTLRCQTTEGERVLQHVESGDLLRDAMLAAAPPVDVYTAWGKVTNCSGGGDKHTAGQCGTCVVEVVNGSEYLSERNDAEQKHLRKKPQNWRLSCQTNIGDGEDCGDVTIKTKPK